MPERLTLIVNPVAGRGCLLDWCPDVPALLAARGEVKVIVPPTALALDAAARAAASDGQLIVVAGGDGTINRVVNAAAGLPLTLGIIPAGSGNDLGRCLGLPAAPADAALRVVQGTPRAVDLVEVNGRRFCTVGGLGLLAAVSALVARLARPGSPTRPLVRALGQHAYLLAAASHIFLRPRLATAVRVAGEGRDGQWRWEGRCHAVLVANQPVLGAGLQLPGVQSTSNDGECEVCIVPQDWRLRLTRNLGSLRGSRPLPEGALLAFASRRATIDTPRPAVFAADGDWLDAACRFSIAVLPGALRVIA